MVRCKESSNGHGTGIFLVESGRDVPVNRTVDFSHSSKIRATTFVDFLGERIRIWTELIQRRLPEGKRCVDVALRCVKVEGRLEPVYVTSLEG